MPFITTAAAAAEVASVTGVLTAHRAIMFLSVSATSGRANGATRRFLAGFPPERPGCRHPHVLISNLTSRTGAGMLSGRVP
jgi:hypothetical protein